jgi:septum site-determining protein MinC
MLTTEAPSLPRLRVRGRSFMALVVAPEPPLVGWLAALDAQIRDIPGFFAGRPVVVDLSGVGGEGRDTLAILLEGLEARDLRLVGVEGAKPPLLAGTPWSRLATELHGREVVEAIRTGASSERAAAPPEPEPAPPPPSTGSLLIDGPVRSGQSIVFPEGDVTVIGAVASGAEVIAGGSLHVYGALRGRAIAGLNAGGEGRIFCRKLEAEMVGVDRLYRTAEHWGAQLHGRAVQVRCDRGALRLAVLD